MTDWLGALIFLVFPLGLLIANTIAAWRNPLPKAPPTRPVAASDDAEWLLLPFQLVAGLAGLCWCLIGLGVFLAPLLFVAAVIWGALQ